MPMKDLSTLFFDMICCHERLGECKEVEGGDGGVGEALRLDDRKAVRGVVG